MVMKEWHCRAHGNFEQFANDGEVPSCPRGCSKRFVQRVFLTAPSIKGAKTKNTDATLRNLAADFKMTNLKNDKAGGSVMDAMRKSDALRPSWMPVRELAKGKDATDLTALGFGKGMYGKYKVDASTVGRIPQPMPSYQGRDHGGYSKDHSAP